MSVEAMVLRIERERQEADDRANRLYGVLLEAIDELEDMIGYVPEYFRGKWDYDATIARLKERAT